MNLKPQYNGSIRVVKVAPSASLKQKKAASEKRRELRKQGYFIKY